MLPEEQFKTVVASTPLVSIDLVVRDDRNRVLLGQRTNRPAQGYWFVPGGRVLKDESLDVAFARLLREELAVQPDGVASRFLGVYQHFYEDNFLGAEFSTHYVVLAYELQLEQRPTELPNAQHSAYRWLSVDALLADSQVHKHSQWYFEKGKQADAGFNHVDERSTL